MLHFCEGQKVNTAKIIAAALALEKDHPEVSAWLLQQGRGVPDVGVLAQEPVSAPEDWFPGMPEAFRKEALRIATPPAAQPAPHLCDDEGCPHHGTPHECVQPVAICPNCLGTKQPHADDPDWRGRCDCTPPAAQPAVPMTNEQIGKAARDAHIAFRLNKHQTYEHALTRAIEAAHGITEQEGGTT